MLNSEFNALRGRLPTFLYENRSLDFIILYTKHFETFHYELNDYLASG